VLVLAVLLVGAGGLAGAVAAGERGRVAVLAVARPVAVGQQVLDADLMVVHLSPDPGLSPVAAEQRSSVVGRFAAVGLRPGTLLTLADVSDARVPGPGQAVLAVAVKTGLAPARGLVAGDRVLLVAVTGDQAPATSAPAPSGGVAARVVEVGPVDVNGVWTVDVTVDEQVAAGLADAAAAGRVAVLLLPAGG
jgi:hypothetical protein